MKNLPASIAIILLCALYGYAKEPVATSIVIQHPVDRVVLQRQNDNAAEMHIACKLTGEKANDLEVRVLDCKTKDVAQDWMSIPAGADSEAYSTKLSLKGGWYQLEFRAKRAEVVVATGTVEHVGVGEVFITCGQSNSANYGRPGQKSADDRVSTLNSVTGRWKHCEDPQPTATGKGGSPWPILGDLLVKKYGVPVGFICLGIGSTPVGTWTPTGAGKQRLERGLKHIGSQGARAILWHQGESDSIKGTSTDEYAKLLSEVITQSRKTAGWQIPWGVALASYHPNANATPERQQAIIAGQKKVIAEVPDTFQGPETDGFNKRGFLSDGVHFNAKGLEAHAQGWAEVLEPLLHKKF